MHFAWAFADSADARLAIPSFDWELFADAVAAVNLHRAIDDSAQHFARVELRDRRLGAEILAAIGFPCALPREPSGGAEFNFRIGEHPLNSLSFRKQLAESAALLTVIDGHLERGDADSYVACRIWKAQTSQQIEAQVEAFAFGAEAVLDRHHA